jgi:hypothetical protein
VLNPKPNLELCHATIRIFLERYNLKGDLHEVTVDIWTARFFGYERVTNKVYDNCAAAIRIAAMLTGVKPAELQAQIWCHAIIVAGRTPKSYLAAIDNQLKLWED